MSDFKKLAALAIQKAKEKNQQTNLLTEAVRYPEGMTERMHSKLEKQLKTQQHSLGKHPIFPEGDELSFDEKILGDRFADVVKRFKRTHDVENINNREVMMSMESLVMDTMEMEHKHRKDLEDLAVKMIREEYDMDEDAVEINASIVSQVSLVGTELNPSPVDVEVEFDSHEQIVEANEEVYKRRFINAMIQGAAKKCNQMFHMVEDELVDMDPRLPNRYSKMMSAADYMYYVVADLESAGVGGSVNVEFPSKTKPKAVINAEAVTFPVLIHELVKGVMEILSAHGLPKDKKIGKYVIGKADFLNAEPWDMRLGPALWERFTDCFEAEDFNLKHHVYADLVSLPVHEFTVQMKEIMAGTKKGRKIIADMITRVKHELHEDEFNEAMGSINQDNDEGENEGFSWDEFNKD